MTHTVARRAVRNAKGEFTRLNLEISFPRTLDVIFEKKRIFNLKHRLKVTRENAKVSAICRGNFEKEEYRSRIYLLFVKNNKII